MNKITMLALILVQSLSYAESIFEAIEAENYSRVNQLLNEGTDIESKGKQEETPLIFAAKYDHPDIVKLLLLRGAKINARDKFGSTALIWVSAGGRSGIQKILLDSGADIDAQDTEGRSALLRAALLSDWVGTVQPLLTYGANHNVKDKHNKTIIMLLREEGDWNWSMIKLLREWSIKNQKRFTDPRDIQILDGKDHGSYEREFANEADRALLRNFPLIEKIGVAIEKGDLNEVKGILDSNVVNLEEFYKGSTPLMLASSLGHYGIVKLLLSRGAKIDTKDDSGNTAFIDAVRWGRLGVIIVLLAERGDSISLNDIGSGKETALMASQRQLRQLDRPNRSGFEQDVKNVIKYLRAWSIEKMKKFTNPEDIKILDGNDAGSYSRELTARRTATIEKVTGIPTKGPGKHISEYLGDE